MGIRRATRDRWFLGVCGGIAHTYGWNSNLLRLILAAVVIFTAVGIIPAAIVYVILGLVLPEAPEY